MLRTRTRAPAPAPAPALKPINEGPVPTALAGKFATVSLDGSDVDEWEVRPGGMLVQKRNPDSDPAVRPPPLPIRVRVKHGSVYHEIRISPHASFGELKKLLSAETGLHPQGQKLLFKDKERDSNAFLDMSGVKDRSKVVLVEDPTGQAKRFLELRKNSKMEKAAKSVHQISRDVDKLATQVSALESLVSRGKNVAESDVVGLTEQFMNQVLKLDAIIAEGEVKMQRRTQVKRVQKYVETLDKLKAKNAELAASNGVQQKKPSQPQVVVTTKWEQFDLLSSPASASTVTPTAPPPPAPSAAAPPPPPPVRFNWELF